MQYNNRSVGSARTWIRLRFFVASVELKRFSRVKNWRVQNKTQRKKSWNNFIAIIKITWYFQSYFLWRYQIRTESNLTGTQGYWFFLFLICFYFLSLFFFIAICYYHETSLSSFSFCSVFCFKWNISIQRNLNGKEISW